MPIYEYECRDCRRRNTILTLRISETPELVCERCGSHNLRRLMSRFAMPRSEEARLDSLADSANFGDVDENDPRSLARAMRRMGNELGDEFSGDEFDEAVEELESGGDLDDTDDV
jgi:putative FmdB family regulatory protein